MNKLEHFQDIMEETRRNWPHIDTRSGRIRELAWKMARDFTQDDRRRRLTWLRRGKTFTQFMARHFHGALHVLKSAEELAS